MVLKIFYVFLFLYGLSSSAFAKTITVGNGKHFLKITDALQHASDGDTVLIYAGHYKEGNIVVNKTVHLTGVDMPVIDGEKKYEVLTINASGASVSGFKIIRSGYSAIDDLAGIKVVNAQNVVIKNNVFDDNFFGIYIQFGINCSIENNYLKAYGVKEQEIGNGIHCWKSDSIRIIANTVTGHRDGIYLEFVNNSIIWRNTSEKNIRYGLHFMISNNDTYVTNIFRNNGAGVAVMFSKNVNMFNNYFYENWGEASYGLMLKEMSDGHIIGNKFVNNTFGIFMEGASRMIVNKNIFKGNGWGMTIQASCMDDTIHQNNFLGNTFDVSTNGSLVLNYFTNNYWDKYEGYDLNRDGIGDVAFHPLSLFSVIVEKNPPAMILFRSFMVDLLDRSEKLIPSLTPENFVDEKPMMKEWKL